MHYGQDDDDSDDDDDDGRRRNWGGVVGIRIITISPNKLKPSTNPTRPGPSPQKKTQAKAKTKLKPTGSCWDRDVY